MPYTTKAILHPTDFSDNSSPAFRAACALVKDEGVPPVLLHVMLPASAPAVQTPPPGPCDRPNRRNRCGSASPGRGRRTRRSGWSVG